MMGDWLKIRSLPAGLLTALSCLTLATCTNAPTPKPKLELRTAGTETKPKPEPSDQPAWRKAAFSQLPFWNSKDMRPALRAFAASCARFADTGMPDPAFTVPCAKATSLMAAATPPNAMMARAFFADNFTPWRVTDKGQDQGLLTAYYEPELATRRVSGGEFTEPILARPDDLVTVSLRQFDSTLPNRKLMGRVVDGELEPYFTRAQIRSRPGKVLAWGRPADVFFLQVQGSGRIRFADGEVARAAFAGHNGQQYRSIGKYLIDHGDLKPGKASKQGIEAWMEKAGPEKTSALMNENPRYVFFSVRDLRDPKKGPLGTQGVALTAGASLAVDTRHYPFGMPVWLETRLAETPKDWKGTQTGVLAITQDSGGAIKGALRGDLFMGSGDAAGKLAGIQHHQASWWVLLPNAMSDMRERQLPTPES